MTSSTKTIAIVSSIAILGGVAFLIFKGNKATAQNKPQIKLDDNVGGNQNVLTQTPTPSVRPNYLASLGLEVPKISPIKFPSFAELLKQQKFTLGGGKASPNLPTLTSATPSTSTFGIGDLTKFDKYKI